MKLLLIYVNVVVILGPHCSDRVAAQIALPVPLPVPAPIAQLAPGLDPAATSSYEVFLERDEDYPEIRARGPKITPTLTPTTPWVPPPYGPKRGTRLSTFLPEFEPTTKKRRVVRVH